MDCKGSLRLGYDAIQITIHRCLACVDKPKMLRRADLTAKSAGSVSIASEYEASAGPEWW